MRELIREMRRVSELDRTNDTRLHLERYKLTRYKALHRESEVRSEKNSEL